MAGAIAGTSILQTIQNKQVSNTTVQERKEQLDTITVTINNLCNLACGHCYLQLEKNEHFIDEKTIQAIINSSAKRIVIAGKEIGVRIEKSSKIIQQLVESGKQVSAITNGLNLQWFNQDLLRKLEYIDVSFDGGPKTYARSTYSKLMKNIEGIKQLNALHTIYSENLKNINDMLQVPGNIIMFSPYLETKHFGKNNTNRVELTKLIEAFAESKIREYNNATLLLDSYHLSQDNASFEKLQQQVVDAELEDRVVFVEKDSIELGIIRVTYDGKVMSPKDSLHPRLYDKNSMPVGNLDEQYKQLLQKYIITEKES